MNTLIVAPHVDDELIGCYSVLAREQVQRALGEGGALTVLYLHELSGERRKEAEGAARHFGFTPIFTEDGYAPIDWETMGDVYIPRRQDKHPQHRSTNARWRTQATHFYGVDMTAGAQLLSKEAAEHKCKLLYGLYPSQRHYFDQHAECWMFEHITEQDYSVNRTWRFGSLVSVTACEDYEAAVHEWAAALRTTKPHVAFNDLVALCPEGTVRMRWGDQAFQIDD